MTFCVLNAPTFQQRVDGFIAKEEPVTPGAGGGPPRAEELAGLARPAGAPGAPGFVGLTRPAEATGATGPARPAPPGLTTF